MSGHSLLGLLFYGEEVEQIFSAESQAEAMLRFEIALAYALEEAGTAPRGTAAMIEQDLPGFPSPKQLEAIAQGAVLSGNIAIPFIKVLTAQVREHDVAASDFVHFGATSQDLLDTALILQLRQVFALIRRDMDHLCAALVKLTQQHGETLLAGRTWLQQGPPIPFALKAAGWLSAMLRHRERILAVGKRALVLQFGGAVGTLASLGPRAPKIAEALARRLQLRLPDLPWHSQRDIIAEVGTTFGLLIGTLGKIARDLSLMMQTEIAELHEAMVPGKGGSSTMPHKRNPLGPAMVLSASLRAPGLVATLLSSMVQEHERGLGGWQAEWETVPELCKLACGAIAHTASVLSNIEVEPITMRQNLDRLRGITLAESVSIALSPYIGHPAAHAVLEGASRDAILRQVSLEDVLREHPEVTHFLSDHEIAESLKPENYLGQAQQFIANTLATAARSLSKGEPDDVDDGKLSNYLGTYG